MKRTAKALAARGVAIVPLFSTSGPLCSCKMGLGCPSPGKHPTVAGGWKGATKDPAEIDRMLSRPRNIAIACGQPSGGIIVLDVDPRNGGNQTLQDLVNANGKLPPTTIVHTGGGGYHFWFRDAAGLIPRTVKVGPGIELLSTGNLAVLPPSIHHSGKHYSWARKAKLADVPGWIVDLAQQSDRPTVNMGTLSLNDSIPAGSRNSELTRLAGMLVGRGCNEDIVHTVIAEINTTLCDPPMPDDEVVTLVQSVCRYGPDLRMEPFNDQGNARRLVRLHGRNMRWLATRKTWLIWDGKRWAANDDEAMRLAKTVPEMLDAVATQEPKKDRAKAIKSWARTSGSKGKLDAMLQLASTEPGLSVDENELDAQPWLLNTPGGIIDLRNGKTIPHDPDLLLSRMTNVSLQPGPARQWRHFLSDVLDGDRDLARFIATAAGYSLTGSTREQVLFLLWGEGANGKTTFLEALRYVLGDYSINTPFNTFTAGNGSGPRNDIARLSGVRFTLATEGDEGSKLDEAIVKRLTGGDTITARYLFKEFFDYEPRFKIWLATNYRPRIRGADHAIWRRIRLVPFVVQIPKDKQDKDLNSKLEAEAGEILHWLVEGAKLWYTSGLHQSAKVDGATLAYRADQDVLGQFISECCLIGGVHAERSLTLYQVYYKWALEQGERPWANRTFTLRLEERGFNRQRKSSGVWWLGIGISPNAPSTGLTVLAGGNP